MAEVQTRAMRKEAEAVRKLEHRLEVEERDDARTARAVAVPIDSARTARAWRRRKAALVPAHHFAQITALCCAWRSWHARTPRATLTDARFELISECIEITAS